MDSRQANVWLKENLDNWHNSRRSFDAAAEYYDMYRPSYPVELVNCIIEKAGLAPGASILEIGAGSGKATALFADKGFKLLCIEPGQQLAAIGQRRFANHGHVHYAVSLFEAWSEPESAFNLAISAQAFHWVAQPLGYHKIARALKSGSYMALFWNMYMRSPDGVDDELSAFRLHDTLTDGEREERIQSIVTDIVSSGCFEQPMVYQYPWSQRYSTEDYIGFLATGNSYLCLPAAEQERIAKQIAVIIERYGGAVLRPYVCALYLARVSK